ncbi:hypothetical protein SETIT_1G087600v2 [Setaria italica]|uniref:Calmodulin-binding domain-containing protein n=2 Tax=Setaria italica TaxID=4555 RepID=A0A368PJ87_SETIT|nr:homeobox protein ARX [Setaria italica]RCV05478.1 hypothetical protein SETIT_1G087600v2 [Setaria italica]
MQIQPCSDPHLHLGSMKVKLEIPAKTAMEPSRSLPRSASELADPPSPFSSNPAHHPVSMPTTPAGASSSASASFGCIAARPATDSPPSTPSRARSSKPTTPAAAAAAYYASLWSPRRLMQRAARAFRSSRSRRVRADKDAGEERASSPTSRVSDEARAASVVGAGGATEIAGGDGHGDGAGIVQQQQEEEERHDHPEVVPEKIIHEMNHHAPPVFVTEEDGECGAKTTPAEEKETTPAAAAATVEEDVESPKKGAALMTLEPAPEAAVTTAEEVADKFVTVVKKAIRKHEEEQGEKKGAAGKFQLGSRVKTAMEARPESEQPQRREVARSNDVIEEARSKLLEKRQCSRVRALVGAFETVMEAAAAGTPRNGTPRHGSCKSA